MYRPKVDTIKTVILIFGALVVGVIAGYGSNNVVNSRPVATPPVEVRANLPQYQFVNPLLYLGTNKDLYTAEYKDLVGKLNAYIQSATASGTATTISVYYRDMNTGHWTGINEDDLYHPSSMLKVLTLVAVAQLAENSVMSLSDELPYSPGDTSLQYYQPDDNMATGTYSIQDLSEAMTIYSDNGANAALLSNQAINDEFTALYKLFRLPAATSSTDDFISPRSYSTIWRALYNGTLLSDSTSERVLQLLSYTAFKDGLVAGVPTTVEISHKFGEFTLQTPSGTIVNRELHDCGIIYYPGHPYMLCVMTKGANFPDLAKAIADISRVVYDFMAATIPAGK